MQLYTILITFLGLFVGLLMGLTGAGGGILSVPLLIYVMGLPFYEATPIALASVATSAFIGAYLAFRSKILRYKAAMLMSAIGLATAPLGLAVANLTPEKPLILIFGFLLLFISARMLIHACGFIKTPLTFLPSPALCQLNESTGKLIWSSSCLRVLFLTGACTGFLSGLLGVGGGFILVPALQKFTNLPMKSIVGTTLGVIAIVSTGSVFFSTVTGSINLNAAVPFIFGSVLGLFLGRTLIERINPLHVQKIFSVFTICVALNMLHKSIF